MTTVYYTLCNQLPNNTFEKAVSSLPSDMQQRLRRFRRWQDAHSYLLGRLLLKEAMSQLGYNYSLNSLQRTEYGKPYFENSDFGFNISHSGEYIVCVISTDETQNLGIDVEEIKPIVIDDFADVFSSKEEREINNYDTFYTFWTRKEAIVKADGRGLQIPLKTIDTTNLSVTLENDKYNLYNIDIDEKYKIHVAMPLIIKNIEINYFQMPN